MKRCIVLLILTLISSAGIYAQKTLVAYVADSISERPLMYCIITSQKTGETFLSNNDGLFRIPFANLKDTLIFTHLGFKEKIVPLYFVKDSSKIYMTQEIFEENDQDIMVGEERDDIKLAAKKLINSPSRQSRAYFAFETDYTNDHGEMTSFFLSTTVKGAKLQKLKYKNGRFGIIENVSKFQSINRYLHSTPDLWTSIVLIAYSPHYKNEFIPINPLTYIDSVLVDSFWICAYGNQNTESTRHFKFSKSLNDTLLYFDSEIWTCKQTTNIKQIKLTLKNADKLPLFKTKYQKDGKLELLYRFSDAVNNENRLINIQYSYNYTDDFVVNDRIVNKKAENKGIIHFYNYHEGFYFPKTNSMDGVDLFSYLVSTPFDDIFWKYENSIPLSLSQTKKLNRIISNGFQINYDKPKKDEKNVKIDKGNGLLLWNKDEYLDLLNNVVSDTTVAELDISIYCDIHQYPDTILFTTFTTLDLSNSKYNFLPAKKENLAYQNILFDLVEILRHNLVQKLKTMNDIKSMRNAHAVSIMDLKSLLSRYQKETKLGKNLDVMKEWNDRVYNITGIDSFKIFDVKYKPKKKKEKKSK